MTITMVCINHNHITPRGTGIAPVLVNSKERLDFPNSEEQLSLPFIVKSEFVFADCLKSSLLSFNFRPLLV